MLPQLVSVASPILLLLLLLLLSILTPLTEWRNIATPLGQMRRNCSLSKLYHLVSFHHLLPSQFLCLLFLWSLVKFYFYFYVYVFVLPHKLLN